MGKKKVEPEVDFSKMAEETRAKMQEKATQGKKIGRRKAVPTLTYQPGDFVSYRHTEGAHTRYIAAVFSGEPSGLYELKLAPHSGIEVGAGGTLWADPEEVTPRVLRPITNFAPLIVGDRVEREICASDEQVPLEGVCTVMMCSDDVVTIADQGGKRWEGTVDKRLALRGRASLLAALADLGYSEEDISEAEPRKTEPAPEVPDDVAAPAELPGTPVLLPTSGVQMIPWEQIDPSPLNPRKKFDDAALRELAIDIEKKGVLQNLVARPNPSHPGSYEIAAGERRYRAVSLLVMGFEENGVRHQVPADFRLPVLVRDLSDRELLEVATAENVQRRRMTPMEEAEAFAAIAAQGATPAEIAHKFGYAERTVTRRIQIAQNLSDAVKEAFDKGEVTLEKAEILALAPKKQQKALLDSVRYYGGASELRNAISKQAFQVANALFDTALYSGEIVEDLFGDVPAYFQDAKQAAELQTQHLEGLAKEAEAGGAAFAQVVVHNGAYFSGNFEFPLREGATGQVWVMDTRTGKVEHLTGRVRRADEVAERPTVQRAEYGWQNRNLAKKLKDEAVITALYANPRLTQAAFVASQLVGYSDFGVECPSPEMVAACEQAAELSGGVLARPDSVEEGLLVVGSLPLTEEERAEVEAEAAAEGGEVDWDEVATDPYPEDAVLGALLDLPEDVLGQLVLIGLLDSACHTELMDPLAHRTGASIAGKVEVTGELLAPMNRPALIEVAVEAGLEAEEVSKQSDDEIRACLLEVASDLKAEGFVPSFMDFERPEQAAD